MDINVENMINNNQLLELYTLARYYYREFEPIMDDQSYEVLQDIIKQRYPDCKLLRQTYDDDEVPTALINIFANGHILERTLGGNKYAHLLADELSLSILPVDSWIKTYEFVHNLPKGIDLCASLKVDGVNQKSAYVRNEEDNNYEFKCSLSRGRAEATPKDYTEHLAKVVPLQIKVNSDREFLDIRGEVYTDQEGIEKLKEDYSYLNIKYANAKSTAGSMLTRGYPCMYYQHLHMLAFYCPGLADTASGTFSELNKLGFKTPPNLKLNTKDAPEDFTEFREWMKKYLDKIFLIAKDKGIPSDGVVLEVDDLNFEHTIDGQYASRNIALKLEQWGYKYYRGIVTGIIDEQQRVFGSLRVTIEPLITEDGCEAKVVNVYNPSILINNNITIGSEVYFERKSETYTTLIYGDRLEEMLRTGELTYGREES